MKPVDDALVKLTIVIIGVVAIMLILRAPWGPTANGFLTRNEKKHG